MEDHRLDGTVPGIPPAGGHLIVCGLGGLAIRLVGALHQAGASLVVVDPDPSASSTSLLEQLGVPLVVGPPRLAAVLERAGAGTAAGLICAEDDDLRSLESALAAHRRWPHLRVVSGIANTSVGRALAEVTGPGTVLDVASLAAPSLVQACLSHGRHTLDLEQARLEVRATGVAREASLRDLYGDLVPIAVTRGGGDLEVCPGRDLTVGPGDTATLLGTPEELSAQGIGAGRAAEGDLRVRRGPLRQLVTLAGSLWTQVERPLRITVAGLLALTAAAAVTLRLGYVEPGPGHHHLPLLSAVYFTVETIATVGYGDFSFAHQATWLEVAGIAIILLGVGLLTTLFALLTSQLFGRSLAAALGQRRITGMRGHVVVVGLGSVGVRVVEGLLGEGLGVVAIEREDGNEYLARMREMKVPVITGDASQASTLDAANTAAASAVAVLTSDDLTNLDIGLAVRDHLGPAAGAVPTVMRIFDRELSDSIAESFGFRFVMSTSALAAPWFIGAALGLEIISTFYVERRLFLVAAVTVAPDGGLVGVSMEELSARVRVVGIQSAGAAALEQPPRRATRFAAGDRAWLVGPPEELLTVLRRNAGPGRPAASGAARGAVSQ